MMNMRNRSTMLWISLLTLIPFLAWSQAPEGDSRPLRQDAFGDPLPPGAVARFGTFRFRHAGPVLSLTISRDGSLIASTGVDGPVRVWEAATGRELFTLGDLQWTSTKSAAISPDGGTLADSGGNLWDLRTGQHLREIPWLRTDPDYLEYSPDGRTLGMACPDQVVLLWDVKSGTQVLDSWRQDWGITSFAYSPDGRTLALTRKDGRIILWSADRREVIREFAGTGKTYFSRDGKSLLVQGRSGELPALVDVSTGDVRSLQPKPESKARINLGDVRFVLGDGVILGIDALACRLHYWDVKTGKWLREVVWIRGMIDWPVKDGDWDLCWTRATAVSSDGKMLVTGHYDGRIRRWDLESGAEIRMAKLPEGEVTDCVFSEDGQSLAAIYSLIHGARQDCYRWRRGFVEPDRRLYLDFNITRCGPKALTAAGELLVVPRDKGIEAWDFNTGQRRFELTEGRGDILSIVSSLDGELIASARTDRTVRIWRNGSLYTTILLGRSDFGDGSIFSSDASAILTADESGIRLWDTGTGLNPRRLEWVDADSEIGLMSADPRLMSWMRLRHSSATIKRDDARRPELRPLRGVRMQKVSFDDWHRGIGNLSENLLTEEEWTLAGVLESAHRGPIKILSHSSEGAWMATGGEDGTVVVWDRAELKRIAEDLEEQKRK